MDTLKSIAEEVRQNSAKINGCKRHRFEPIALSLGQKINCLVCGGYMRLDMIGSYIAGYEAHGGSADDVWPGFRDTRRSLRATLHPGSGESET